LSECYFVILFGVFFLILLLDELFKIFWQLGVDISLILDVLVIVGRGLVTLLGELLVRVVGHLVLGILGKG